MIEIAIDGTAASGKGTLAKNLSRVYGYPHLDTGLMYRKVAYNILIKKYDKLKNLEAISCKIANELNWLEITSENLRSEETALMASKIANFTELRNILKSKQLKFANESKLKSGGCILDGRDIGTVILPNANYKFFITASIEVRAARRMLEKNITYLHQNDDKCMLQSLINDMHERDKLDMSRSSSPLTPAEDAWVIDTSSMNANKLTLLALEMIEGKN
jgi:cytidylate kinase